MRVLAGVMFVASSLALASCGGSSDPAEEPAAAAETVAVDAATPLPSERASPSPSPSASDAPAPTPSPSASASPAAAPAAVAAAAPVTAPAAFNQCKVCHSVEKGDHGLGPSLAGVYGTKAGEIPGFDFSDAMKSSGLVWNEANLNKYLENPQGTVPGTRMAFAGMKDAAKRKAVIDYMKSL